MSIRNLIILSQLNPPAQRSRVLLRERVNQRLDGALNFPLTILEAGTGYGKSTAILSFLREKDLPIYWFTISGTDRDPKLFLAKLFTAFNQHDQAIGDEALRILDMPDATQEEALIAFVNALEVSIETDTLFILDDFHQVDRVPEVMGYIDWMIENLPRDLHVVIATRHGLSFPSMNKWRVKGALLEISKDELTFTGEEVQQLFASQYDIQLDEETVTQLLEKTEGWAIGLQMVWQTLQNNPGMSIRQVLEDERQSRTALFDYLAEEVLSGQTAERQGFLLATSILSKLDSATCDFLLTAENSDQVLNQLHNSGLFIEELRPGVYRYHQIFREFLQNRLQRDTKRVVELHRKIASYFSAHEYWEEALSHLLSASDYHQINQILENIGEKMIHDGRQESINYWISEIPESIRQNYPYLLFLLGEVNRYLGHFEEALEYYHTAERLYRRRDNDLGISKALMGQGRVFLDTIRPINADQLLQDALKLLDPVEMKEEVADLLVLTGENQLNLGLPDSAQELLSQASELRPELDMETDLVQARVYLRTGRLQEGIDLLQDREANRPVLPPSRPQRFHRESTLLLSLFYAIKGEVARADLYARQGIEIGKLLRSTFVQSVGYMRLGHALLLQSQHPFNQDGVEMAMQYYQESIDKVDVTRIHVEPLWGMCRALGYTYHIRQAEQLALESLEIAKKAGDEWISILIQLSLGAGEVLTGNYEAAQQYLTTAETSSLKVKDPFTLCVARMWLALRAWRQGYQNTAFGYLEKVLPVVRERDYTFLLTRESLMGLKDREMIYPLLLAAAENNIEKPFIKSLLKGRGIDLGSYHPGYALWVQTFGGFKVWRGDQAIDPDEWKREKARQLFQLLVAHRDKWLHRDQINTMLWADTSVENATNYLKVVLNALNQVLEPERPRGESAFFVERRQELYRLNPNARIVVDAEMFTEEISDGSLGALENAVKLYQGRYFADSYVQEWLVIEEQYYHQQFLLAAERLTAQLMDEGEYQRALDVTYKILGEDALWESAYRAQMSIFYEMGKPSMVREVFKQAQDVFHQQMDSDLSPATEELYESLLSEANPA
jgi:DNA-binding SARP family transcriptional activator/tetratricopeptide (TPR) repeat protein